MPPTSAHHSVGDRQKGSLKIEYFRKAYAKLLKETRKAECRSSALIRQTSDIQNGSHSVKIQSSFIATKNGPPTCL